MVKVPHMVLFKVAKCDICDLLFFTLMNRISGWVSESGTGKNIYLKGTVARDFLLLVFFMNQHPPRP
jgi:hypothetical protein